MVGRVLIQIIDKTVDFIIRIIRRKKFIYSTSGEDDLILDKKIRQL